MFTKKHFIVIAKILKRYYNTSARWVILEMIEDFCELFKKYNDRFDEVKFKNYIKGV